MFAVTRETQICPLGRENNPMGSIEPGSNGFAQVTASLSLRELVEVGN
jgi:hypothetical protein